MLFLNIVVFNYRRFILFEILALLLSTASCRDNNEQPAQREGMQDKYDDSEKGSDEELLKKFILEHIEASESGSIHEIMSLVDDRIFQEAADREFWRIRLEKDVDFKKTKRVKFPKDIVSLRAKYRILDKETTTKLMKIWEIDIPVDRIVQVTYEARQEGYYKIDAKNSSIEVPLDYKVEVTAILSNGSYKVIFPKRPDNKEIYFKTKDLLDDIKWIEFVN